MKCSIVTPTFNSWCWLQACLRSVADQVTEGVQVHHHVQDGGSSDGTPEQLAAWQEATRDMAGYSFSYASGKDAGMYDAINLAWEQLPTDCDLIAHLNSDEQYLPQALAQVAAAFSHYPKAEALLGGYIILDAQLRYIAHRRPVSPKLWSSRLHCNCITNSTFFRASAFRARRVRYDSRWRLIGDLVLYRDLLQQGMRFQTIPLLTTTFVCTGENLAWSEASLREWQQLVAESPRLYQRLGILPHYWVNVQRRWADWRLPSPQEYGLYVGSASERQRVKILAPTCKWGGRRKANEGTCEFV